MTSTKGTFSTNLFIVTKSYTQLAYDALMSELSSNNLQTTPITLHLSYAYSNEVCQYKVISRIINGNHISLNDVLICASQHIALDGYTISYSNENNVIYFHCGVYPIEETVLCELTASREIWVKLRQDTNDSKERQLSDLEEEEERPDWNEGNEHYYDINPKCKRSKERNIGDTLKKLYLWRRLYHDVYDKEGNKVKLTWKKAAEITDISLKSLDCYSLQVRYGKLLGFDFNKHKNEKIGVLRGFIKFHMKKLDQVAIRKLKAGKYSKNRDESKHTQTETESEEESCCFSCDSEKASNSNIFIDENGSCLLPSLI